MKTSILAMKCAKLYWPTSTTKLTLFHSIRSAQVLSAAHNSADKWTNLEVMTKLRAEAKQQGLWNLFLPKVSNLSNLEYAELAEIPNSFGSLVFARFALLSLKMRLAPSSLGAAERSFSSYSGGNFEQIKKGVKQFMDEKVLPIEMEVS